MLASSDVSGWPSVRDVFALTKPSITLLVVVTAVPGLLLPAGPPSTALVLATLIGTGLSSASAAILNQLFESDIDSRMGRTHYRALASGRLGTGWAWGLALFLLVAAMAILAFGANPLAAGIALAGHLFYSVFYTLYLKRRTAQNIVIGGLAGAVGPLIGWAAATGTLAWPAWVLFLIIALWTPPHFWALAIRYKSDYAQVGIPMYPVVHGEDATRRMILGYTLLLIPTTLSLWWAGVAGPVYGWAAVILTGRFVWEAWRIQKDHSDRLVMSLFYYSCYYTLFLFAALTVDSIL